MPFVKLSDVKERVLAPGFRTRFVHGEHMSVGEIRIEAGAVLPTHSHPHEQVTSIVSGQLRFTIGDETTVLEPGVVAVIPPHAPHSGKALTDCVAVDAFCPVREDFR